MRKHIQNIFSVIFLLSMTVGFSQRKPNDTLNTDVIDVVKPYVPTVSDAFKVETVPVLDDETTDTKKEVEYTIFSVPVASTFKPSKGKATVVKKKKYVKAFDNYASLGVGNFRTILADFYVNQMISRNESVGGFLTHHSSNGGIPDALVNDGFSETDIGINYASKLRDMSWRMDAGFEHQFYNWYGIPEPIASDIYIPYYLEPGHSFFDIHAGADFTFDDSYVTSSSLLLRHFSDSNESSENRVLIKTTLDFPIEDINITTQFKLDYLSGNFAQSYTVDNSYKYGNFQVGAAPSFEINKADFTLNVGIWAIYFNDSEADESKFYVYPNITGSYRFVDDLVIGYGGVTGDLIQNTYHGFANENPFVSPTLDVKATSQGYNAFAGVRGKVTQTLSYDVSGRYYSDENKAFFKSNMILDVSGTNAYDYGNSFGVVYDKLTTFGLSGSLNLDMNNNLKMGVAADYFIYTTDAQAEAWNLPEVQGTLFMDYQINTQWFAGANLFFVGSRKDEIDLQSAVAPEIYTIDGYFDMNINGGYHINDQFTVFVKANNIMGNSYERWINYQVQGFQLVGGATYKFDF